MRCALLTNLKQHFKQSNFQIAWPSKRPRAARFKRDDFFLRPVKLPPPRELNFQLLAIPSKSLPLFRLLSARLQARASRRHRILASSTRIKRTVLESRTEASLLLGRYSQSGVFPDARSYVISFPSPETNDTFNFDKMLHYNKKKKLWKHIYISKRNNLYQYFWFAFLKFVYSFLAASSNTLWSKLCRLVILILHFLLILK